MSQASGALTFFRGAISWVSSFKWVVKKLVRRRMTREVSAFQLNTPYISCPVFEDGLRRAILHPDCGVHVLWGPSNLGKSCSTRHVARLLQAKKEVTGVLFVKGESTVTTYGSPMFWLKECMGISKDDRTKFISEFVEEDDRLLVVIDQFDHIMTHALRQSFLESLAENSKEKKNFVVLVCVSGFANYEEIISWNGRSKIRPCFTSKELEGLRWSRQRLQQLLDKVREYDAKKNTPAFPPPIEKEKFLEVCEKVATPGFLLEGRANRDLECMREEANMLSQRWNLLKKAKD